MTELIRAETILLSLSFSAKWKPVLRERAGNVECKSWSLIHSGILSDSRIFHPHARLGPILAPGKKFRHWSNQFKTRFRLYNRIYGLFSVQSLHASHEPSAQISKAFMLSNPTEQTLKKHSSVRCSATR